MRSVLEQLDPLHLAYTDVVGVAVSEHAIHQSWFGLIHGLNPTHIRQSTRVAVQRFAHMTQP